MNAIFRKYRSSIQLCFILILGLSNFFGFCYHEQEIRYIYGKFPIIPENLSVLNSPYDEINSAPPPSIYGDFNFYFSSDKNSLGKHFDILATHISYNFDQYDGSFYIYALEPDYYYSFAPQLTKINTAFNEYGPNFYFSEDKYNFLFYSSDKSGKTLIYCTIHDMTNGYDTTDDEGPFPVNIINSMSSNDGYLTVDSINKTVYFMSDRDGDYNIYRRKFPADVSFHNFLLMTSSTFAEKVPELSTTADDKMPFINGKLMVFSSNRPGGFGGFDLWWSVLENGVWSAPVNFGESINSQYDELRPVVIYAEDFVNDLMIFSSNRPGGEGGFDLYYVGVQKRIK